MYVVWYNAHVRAIQKLNKSFLEEAYVKRRLSTWAIEKEYGFSRSSVFKALKRFNIPTRTIAEAHVKYARTDFSDNKLEKAYLLGFSIGDLRVRNHNKDRSETISIACGSTKSAQVDLIENLFKSYGRVWKGKPNNRGVVNIEAFVNMSFDFLLPEIRDYTWCKNNPHHFYAFLAGFTDAEGSLYISQGKAFISWGNYDQDILHFIQSGLKKFDVVSPRISCDRLKGYTDKHGYIRNQNYCRLYICKKSELAKLIKNLKPHLRHADKLKGLAFVEKNIKLRNT